MTVALRMTGALLVTLAGHAARPLRARRLRAGRRARAALPGRPQVRPHRPVARRRPAQRRRRSRRAVAAGGGGRPPLPDRRGLQRPRSGAAPARLHRATARGAAGAAGRRSSRRCCSTRASSPASATSTPTRRYGALGSIRCARPTRSTPRTSGGCIGPCARCCAQGIDNRGASFSDYVGADGEPGDNAERLAVYRRTEQPCYRCGRPIRRIVVGQRSTHFCPRCQPRAGRIGRGMKVIGLTGNIGCGKSTVAGMLREPGVATIDADAVAREIRNNDADARAEIEAAVRDLRGRCAGARSSSATPTRWRDLERILHPRVRGAVRARLAELEEGGVEVAGVEAIKLLESPLADACDQVWVVRCEEADAIRRLAESRGMGEADARRAAGQPVVAGGEGGGRGRRDRRVGADRGDASPGGASPGGAAGGLVPGAAALLENGRHAAPGSRTRRSGCRWSSRRSRPGGRPRRDEAPA